MRLILLIFMSILLTGCFNNNPLIGKWKATKNLMLMTNIEFTKDKVIYNGIFEKVKYEINDNKVLVTGQLGVGKVYKIIDDNTISMRIPLMGVIKYKRITK